MKAVHPDEAYNLERPIEMFADEGDVIFAIRKGSHLPAPIYNNLGMLQLNWLRWLKMKSLKP